jgi:beta-lactam-binding protein with PASTA domain
MRVCPRCDRTNDDDLDFCKHCGEFLDWDGRGENGAVAAGAAGAEASTVVTVAPPVTEHVTVRLFHPGQPDDDSAPILSVPAGGRVTLVARVRNQSDIVDSYELTVEGLPSGWFTIDPVAAYLLPSPRDGHEEDVVIALHPPRTSLAAAGHWSVAVVATSQSRPSRRARATATLEIEPFSEISAGARPAVVTGRRRASLLADVTNTGNTTVPVELAGADAGDRCRVDVPPEPVRVPPGQARSIPVAIRPKRPRWIGQPLDHPLDFAATTADDQKVAAPFAARYRQRAWVPWWLPIVLVLLALAALLIYLLWPDRAEVPNLKHSRSAFAAQKRLERRGLTLNPKIKRRPRQNAAPGTVVDQAPAPGKTVDKGKAVSVVVAAGSGRVRVPNVVGLLVTSADQKLHKAGLTLGAVTPKIKPHARVGAQVPRARVLRLRGSPVNVVLAKAGKGKKKSKTAAGEDSGGGAPVPAVGGGSAAAAAAALKAAGLTPVTELRIDPAKRGTVLRTEPAKGEPPPDDGRVTLIVSAGFPRVAYDDGHKVLVAGGIAGTPVIGVARHSSVTSSGAWSADGRQVAYVSSGSVFVARPGSGERPREVDIGDGRRASVVSFAPFRRRMILAFVDRGHAVCWLDITGGKDGNASCRSVPGGRLEGITWSPRGTEMLAPASGKQGAGLLRLSTPVPFSSDAEQWSARVLVTPNPDGRRVRAVAFAPDAKLLAVVANIGTHGYRVALVKPRDLKRDLDEADYLPVAGCDVAWRSDGAELAVVQAGAGCREPVGRLIRVRTHDPRERQTIAPVARHPSWQPIDLNPGPAP